MLLRLWGTYERTNRRKVQSRAVFWYTINFLTVKFFFIFDYKTRRHGIGVSYIDLIKNELKRLRLHLKIRKLSSHFLRIAPLLSGSVSWFRFLWHTRHSHTSYLLSNSAQLSSLQHLFACAKCTTLLIFSIYTWNLVSLVRWWWKVHSFAEWGFQSMETFLNPG